MIRVRAFSGFDLDMDGTGPLVPNVRPRVMALLAVLVGHGPRGISRDKILAYLWPDSDTVHARNSLKQALFSFRQTFGRPVVLCSFGLVRLDPKVVEADLWLFESAITNGQEASAVSLYRGPFLDGFYISGLDEFERWVESMRLHLAADHAKVLQALAVRAERAGDWPAASAWWRRLAECEPYSTTAALGVMHALESAGDPTGAVEHARRHAARVRAELGCPVADEVVSLVQRLVTRAPVHREVSRARATAPLAYSPHPKRAEASRRAPT